jgi:cholesterol transport system auxiliary component
VVRLNRSAVAARGGRAFGLVLLSALLLACAAPAPAPQDRFYTLQAPLTPAPTAPPRTLAVSLSVEDLAARGFLGGRQIVYRTAHEPLRVRRYPQLLWEVPPGRALAGQLVAALRAAGPFELVLSSQRRVRGDYVLSGELTRFEHLPTSAPPHVAADFTLTLVRNADRRVLMNRRYLGREPAGAGTPAAMVSAFNRLAGRLTAEAAAEIGRLVPGP